VAGFLEVAEAVHAHGLIRPVAGKEPAGRRGRHADGGGRMSVMDVSSGEHASSGMEPDLAPELDEFLLARIAEDKRFAVDAAAAAGRDHWTVEDASAHGASAAGAAEFVARYDPVRVLAECAAKRRVVLTCREAQPDLTFLGTRPPGMADFPLAPGNERQLAALTLAQLALPYAEHHDYRPDWRP
jgi:uncharacterized protein DUF6221